MIKNIIIKFKEQILYLVFGGLTTLVNIGVYALCTRSFGIEVMAATVVAWAVSVAFAFFTNKFYVFESKEKTAKIWLKESVSFVAARVFSMFLELLIMYIFVEKLRLNDMLFKVIANIVVIIVNYILSKFWIFKSKNNNKEKADG